MAGAVKIAEESFAIAADGAKAGAAPHAGRAIGRKVDVAAQGVAGVVIHHHQLQLMGVVDIGAEFRLQERPGIAVAHDPGVVEVRKETTALAHFHIALLHGLRGGQSADV